MIILDYWFELIYMCCYLVFEEKLCVVLILCVLGGFSIEEIVNVFLDKLVVMVVWLMCVKYKFGVVGVVFKLFDL